MMILDKIVVGLIFFIFLLQSPCFGDRDNEIISQQWRNQRIFDFLKSKCHVASGISSPNEFDGYPTALSLDFIITKFVDIDDVLETFEIIANLQFTWNNSCVKEALKSGEFPISNDTIELYVSPEDFWYPTFLQTDSTHFEPNQYQVSMRISVQHGTFTVSYPGKYESSCELDFWLFPFDIQTCQIHLLVIMDSSTVSLVSARSRYRGPNWVPKNSNWVLINSSFSYHNADGGGQMVLLEYTFKRDSRYYTSNILYPGVVLSLLEMACFFIPPDTPDRSSYAATIMLTMFVLHSQILTYIPKTPQPLVMSYYIMAEIGFGTFCTIYSTVMCWLINENKRLSKHFTISLPLCNKKTRVIYYKLIDFIVFWTLLATVAILNAVAMFVSM